MPSLEYPLDQKEHSIKYHQTPYSKYAGDLFSGAQSKAYFTDDKTPRFYHHVFKEIPKEAGTSVTECQCLPGYVRDSSYPHQSLRGLLDYQAAQIFLPFAWRIEKPTLFFFGSGKLLNEATLLASLMNRGVSPRIVLIDRAYNPIDSYYDASAVTALNKFKIMIDHIASTMRVKAEIHFFYDFQQSLQTFIRHGMSIHAFFMLDVFFPSSEGMKIFKTEINAAFRTTGRSDVSYDTLFFLLNKKADGPIKYPVIEPRSRPPYAGLDAAALNIYKAPIVNGNINDTVLLFESIF